MPGTGYPVTTRENNNPSRIGWGCIAAPLGAYLVKYSTPERKII